MDIKPGSELPPVRKSITQEMINRWAEVSGDFNPLHVDPGFAEKSRFGGTIAHGHLSLAFLCEMMSRYFGKKWVCGGKLRQVKFTAPVRPGYEMSVKGVVQDVAGKIVCDVWLENQEGEKCIVGRAEVPL